MRYLRTETVPLGDLDYFPGNARTGDVTRIRESVRRFGQFRSLICREGPGGRLEIVAGNHTAMAMREEGYEAARVEVGEYDDDAEASRVNAADNRLAELGGYDPQLLAAQLARFEGDYSGTGWAEQDLAILQPPPSRGDPDDVPEPPENGETVARSGDLWRLGPHRLLCADVRSPGALQALMGGREADLAFTSPPYADRRPYDESTVFRPVPPEDYVDWFEPVAAGVAGVLAGHGSWFVNIKAGVAPDGLDTELYVLDLVLAHVRRWGWHFATEFCWERVGVPKKVTRRFKNQFEPVYQFTRGPWRTFPGAVAGLATAGRFGSLFEPIYQFTRGDWKMRPETVRHPSDNVPISGGPGVGETNWAAAQGGNGEIFGRRKGKHDGHFGAKGFHIDQHQGEGAEERAAHVAEWERRAASGELRPTGSRANVSASQGVPRQHPHTGAMSDRQGAPVQPGEYTMAGLAYPGNRLPTFAGTHTATGHAAAFPVGLPAFFIKAYTDWGDAVLDPFLGSGSTLIAAHINGRAGFGCEISPAYCDIVLRRFERFTGITPELESRVANDAEVSAE